MAINVDMGATHLFESFCWGALSVLKEYRVEDPKISKTETKCGEPPFPSSQNQTKIYSSALKRSATELNSLV
jgi:hypothetical protein